jgi:hypothetical protein
MPDYKNIDKKTQARLGKQATEEMKVVNKSNPSRLFFTKLDDKTMVVDNKNNKLYIKLNKKTIQINL